MREEADGGETNGSHKSLLIADGVKRKEEDPYHFVISISKSLRFE